MASGMATYSTILKAGSKSSNTVQEFLGTPRLAVQSVAVGSMLDTREARHVWLRSILRRFGGDDEMSRDVVGGPSSRAP